jgi:hypothetical protein
LKIDHKYEISDDKMITQSLFNAPSKHYATMVTVLKLEMAKGKLDLEVIKQAFRTIYGTIKQPGGIRKEAALITRTGNNSFKKKFKGDCRKCSEKGHKSADCWEKPTHKDKRPSNWKSSNNSEAADSTANNNPPKYHCDYCDKDRHTEDRCYK